MQLLSSISRTLVTRAASSSGHCHVAPVAAVFVHHSRTQHTPTMPMSPSGHYLCCRARLLHTSQTHALSWREFVTSVQTFGSGAKALYGDMKAMKEVMSKYGALNIEKRAPHWIDDGKTSLNYPRKDLQFLFRVQCIQINATPVIMTTNRQDRM